MFDLLDNAYSYFANDRDGVSGGFGSETTHGDSDDKVTEKSLYANYGVGKWTGRDGNRNEGFGGEGGLMKTVGEHAGRFFDVGWELGSGTANAGVIQSTNPDSGDSTVSTGGGVNGIEGALSISSKDKEDSIRVGGSAGEGAAKRDHYADVDGDGDLERVGIGIDFDKYSVDIKSETARRGFESFADVVSDAGVASVPRPILEGVADGMFGFNPLAAKNLILGD